jgi:hypothetical protein
MDADERRFGWPRAGTNGAKKTWPASVAMIQPKQRLAGSLAPLPSGSGTQSRGADRLTVCLLYCRLAVGTSFAPRDIFRGEVSWAASQVANLRHSRLPVCVTVPLDVRCFLHFWLQLE